MPRRTKKEAPVIDNDLESRGAEVAEIQPVLVTDEMRQMHRETRDAIDNGDVEGMAALLRKDAEGLAEKMVDHGRSVPTDSTEVEPTDEKEALLQLLTSKQVSVTALTEDGGRGLRLYLGKPTMSTFENMLRRSTHGVVIEPDPRREGVSVRWEK